MKNPTFLFLHIIIGSSAKPQKNVLQNSANDSKIDFIKSIHKGETEKKGSVGSCRFIFKNTGNQPIILSNVTSYCSCMVPGWPKDPVMPGNSGVLEVVYNSRKTGSITKTVRVIANAVNSLVYRSKALFSDEYRIVFLFYGCSCFPICFAEKAYRYSE